MNQKILSTLEDMEGACKHPIVAEEYFFTKIKTIKLLDLFLVKISEINLHSLYLIFERRCINIISIDRPDVSTATNQQFGDNK